MNILVTGGMGILGSSLLNILSKKYNKKNIYFLDRNKNKKRKYPLNIDKFKSISGNFNNYNEVYNIIKSKKIDVVFHLGAVTQVIDAYKSPINTFNTNIKGTINICESIRKIDKEILFIYSSSDKAYGSMTKKEYFENDRLHGDFPYDVSKSASDLIVQSYSKTYNLKVGIIRSGNIFGPGDFNLDRLVPGVIVNSIKNKKTYVRSNGKLSRDYVYVDDVARGYSLLLEKMRKDKKRLFIYNIGSKTNLTVIQMINKILFVLKKKELRPIILNNSKIEIKEQKLNYLKARKELNWNIKNKFITDLKKTVNWYKKNISFFR
tara:strand:+ start:3523 stop:4482 length:960 start_codon:yes stop_codon:yes gene_type:complete